MTRMPHFYTKNGRQVRNAESWKQWSPAKST